MRPAVLRATIVSILSHGEMTAEEIRRRGQFMRPPYTIITDLVNKGVILKRWEPGREIKRRLYRLAA